ncbi:hypothetical protein GH714_038069 [Hevea brasiliensis]|uniref:Retrotransposon gag domain-containing protein n=1 Tax=Hevea brasiliensis TaxID=3981 RepID=A0A6A6L838_HEVBR|nr:hypothetical protein GH714_038069 [Hevea brasiliensis]
MSNAHMDSHIDTTERNLTLLEDNVSKLTIDNEQIRSDLVTIKNLLTTLAKGKVSIEVGALPNESPSASIPNVEDTSSCLGPAMIPPNYSIDTSKQMALPSFDGSDPLGWLARMDQYFEIHATKPESKLATALICMDAVHQQATVNEYIDDFVAKATQFPNLSDRYYLSYFLNGLHEELRIRVQNHDATNSCRTMSIAREIERELLLTGGYHPLCPTMDVSKQQFSGLGPHARSSLLPSKKMPTASVASSRNPSLPAKSKDTRLYSKKEFQELCAKGLCFRCKQPYSPLHDCPNKTLCMIIAGEDDSTMEPKDLAMVEGDVTRGTASELLKAHFTCGSSLIFCWSGASHCFVLDSLVKQLSLQMEPTSFAVCLGDGRHNMSSSLCRKLPIDLGVLTISPDCFVFPLGGVNVIFGNFLIRNTG